MSSSEPALAQCDLVLPCRDEAAALEGLLPRVPDRFRVIVVDNGSTDGTAEVASRLGAHVVTESEPGYGSACQSGLAAATNQYVAFMDGDGSFDPHQLLPLLAAVESGRADLAVGRRRPTRRSWPWHARLGNSLIVYWLRRRVGFPAHDLAPMRVSNRAALVDLGVRDRRFGYPLELMCRANEAKWRFAEFDVTYHPRAEGTRSKVSGSVRGTFRVARDFSRVLRAFA